ncbi:uncharacterized protein LOC131869783 [Cryptomeria japonica]|uniref:uncharacterized protein LOC131869783 n=1 Tax=Cryptomeria japonica TaxID=3369 RepID=UPI0027DAA373|nr:uncharacterized protein LOC131869783 [Cryptomeria japonica]
MNAKKQEEKQWDDLILKMADMSVDDAKMARALKRKPDWVLQKLGIERNNISSPRTDKLIWRDVHKDQNEERLEDGRRNGDGENYGNRINTHWANHVGNNGCGINQNNEQNRGKNGNYGSGNGGGRNNGNNNGNNNGGGNNGNNGNYGNNNGIMNNQSNHHVGRQPLIIERYRQLDFTGIVGYPNQIINDLRLSIPKFSGNGVDSAEQHVVIVKNIIKEFEIPHEDVFMKQFVESLTEDVGEWKVARKAAKRDYPKLCSSGNPKKDDLTQIMDMLKDLKNTPILRKLFQEEAVPSLRNFTEEEKKAFTIVAIEQVKSNYQLKNRNVNNEQGKPASIFGKVTKSNGTKNNVAKGKDADAKKRTELEKNKPIEMPKLVKPVEKKQISKPSSNYATFMSQALSRVKVYMPLLEVMKFLEYKDETLKIISNVGNLNKNVAKLKEDPPLSVRNYNAHKRCIMFPDGTALVHFARATIQEVFAVNLEAELPLSVVDLEDEAYEAIDRKLVDEYNLFQHVSRAHYDPKGYIHSNRKRQELGDYFHQKDEFELAGVMETLEKKLEERRQRLENMDREPVQSDLGENEVVFKLRASEKEKDRLIVALNAEIDERMAEHDSFVSDDQFIKSKEFK